MNLLVAGILVLLFSAGHVAYHVFLGWLLWREENPEKEFDLFKDLINKLVIHGVVALGGIVLIVLHFAGVE